MNFKEKYDEIVSLIEESDSQDTQLIRQSISTAYGMADREIGEVFRFISGEYFISYYKKRILKKASDMKRQGLPWETVAERMGYADTRALTNAYKTVFDCKLSDALEIEYGEPLYMDNVLKMESSEMDGKGNSEMLYCYQPEETKTIMGIPLAKYEEIERIMDIQTLYGVGKVGAILSCKLSTEEGYDIEKVFDFMKYYLGTDVLENGSNQKNHGITASDAWEEAEIIAKSINKDALYLLMEFDLDYFDAITEAELFNAQNEISVKEADKEYFMFLLKYNEDFPYSLYEEIKSILEREGIDLSEDWRNEIENALYDMDGSDVSFEEALVANMDYDSCAQMGVGEDSIECMLDEMEEARGDND